MTTKPTNMRLPDRTIQQIADLRSQSGMTITTTTITAIDTKWRTEFEFGFNWACTELAVTGEREPFARYWQRVRGGKGECHASDIWETIYRCYEYMRDHDDERDALTDSLR